MNTLPAPPAWQKHAACASLPPADADRLFFPNGTYTNEVRQLCAGCPVVGKCLEFALENEADAPAYAYGFYGGFTPDERRALLMPSVFSAA